MALCHGNLLAYPLADPLKAILELTRKQTNEALTSNIILSKSITINSPMFIPSADIIPDENQFGVFSNNPKTGNFLLIQYAYKLFCFHERKKSCIKILKIKTPRCERLLKSAEQGYLCGDNGLEIEMISGRERRKLDLRVTRFNGRTIPLAVNTTWLLAVRIAIVDIRFQRLCI
ncbi:hypothetical protein CEXT_206241 [Caerostris extrusa]|uniref:Uncharacterized protein n=1 Tax=Caerostris extrusa TaxID=172846 RepID=A0AAV4QT67_CAEEX|nr:hypothetical protein CEXT_206241 [Caerostris extrusa]